MSWLASIGAFLGARRDAAALLARVAAGDVAALREVYDAHGRRALAIAERVLRDRAEAEDVVQETFVEVWRRARDYDAARGSLPAWIATIARSRAINRVNARTSARRTAEASRQEPVAEVSAPRAELEQRRDQARVRAALAGLPAEQRTALELAYFEGMTQSQIAEHTGEPLGTIKGRIRLAMARLATALAEEDAA